MSEASNLAPKPKLAIALADSSGRPRLLDDPVSGPAQGGEEEARQVRGHLLEAYGDGGGWAAALPGTKRRR